MQSTVAIVLVAMLAAANAGLIGAPAVTLVRSAPIVHAAHPIAYAHHAPVVYAHHAPIAYHASPVIKTIAPAPIVYASPVHKTIVHGAHPVLL